MTWENSPDTTHERRRHITSSAVGLLFHPLRIGTLTLPGRVIKAATSETRADKDGFATQALIDFYLPIAKGGVPLIITGNIYVSPDGKSTPMQMGVDDDDKIPALSRLTGAVHAHGVKIFAQLSHSGREIVPGFAGLREAVSASDVTDLSTGTRPRALTVAEIERVVERFGDAAARCKTAGFDGIEIHAGHGYLISQFLTPYTNRRTDQYGGAPANRVKLLRDVYRAIRARVGADFPVIMKLNGSDYLPLRAGLNTPELVDIAKTLEREGLDAVEVSVGHYESGFPVVRGTFGRCLRNMVQGSVRHLPPLRRVLFTVFWPLVAPRVQPDLETVRRLQSPLRARVQEGVVDSGPLRWGISHPRGHAGRHRARLVRRRHGRPRVRRRSAPLPASPRCHSRAALRGLQRLHWPHRHPADRLLPSPGPSGKGRDARGDVLAVATRSRAGSRPA